MSDISVPRPIRNEYASVGQTRCACGASAFVVERQWLVRTPWGYSDWLEARCRACGATRGFAFPLPSFGRKADEEAVWKVPGLKPVADESIWSLRRDESPVEPDDVRRRILEQLEGLDRVLRGRTRGEGGGGVQ